MPWRLLRTTYLLSKDFGGRGGLGILGVTIIMSDRTLSLWHQPGDRRPMKLLKKFNSQGGPMILDYIPCILAPPWSPDSLDCRWHCLPLLEPLSRQTPELRMGKGYYHGPTQIFQMGRLKGNVHLIGVGERCIMYGA